MRRRRRRSALPAILMILFLVFIAGVAALFFNRYSTNKKEMNKYAYYSLSSTDEVALIVNDTLLDAKGILSGGRVYLDYSTVNRTLCSGFYWESDTGQMLLTLPEGTLKWTPDDGSGDLVWKGETLYIAADCVQKNADIDMEILEEPNRIVARTRWNNLAAETVTEDTPVRYRGGPKSEILTYVSKGDTVILLERTGNWCKISTPDGYLGYVKKDQVEAAPEGAVSHVTDSRFVFDHVFLDKPVCLGWQYVGKSGDINRLDTLTERASCLNVISPTWFSFASVYGELNSFAEKEYVDKAHAKGIQVWATLNDVSGGEVSTGQVLATYEVRSHVISQLMEIADQTGMDGINVDLETLRADTIPQYLQFLKELCVVAHQKGLIISADNYVPAFTGYYNRAEQAKTVDYIVIMGYDEHTRSSDEAGSVASLPFVEQGILDTLAEVPAEQVVNGIPFYSRGWTQRFGESRPSCEAMGMEGADEFVKTYGINLQWDSTVGQNVGSVEDEEARYSIWVEDEKSVEEKMKLVRSYHLAGAAFWRLGFERADVWDVIGTYMQDL